MTVAPTLTSYPSLSLARLIHIHLRTCAWGQMHVDDVACFHSGCFILTCHRNSGNGPTADSQYRLNHEACAAELHGFCMHVCRPEHEKPSYQGTMISASSCLLLGSVLTSRSNCQLSRESIFQLTMMPSRFLGGIADHAMRDGRTSAPMRLNSSMRLLNAIISVGQTKVKSIGYLSLILVSLDTYVP